MPSDQSSPTEAPDPRAARTTALQDLYAPMSVCFGCGPQNPHGLHVKSLCPDGTDELVARFRPAPHHVAFPGVLNGGIIGTLLDCHSNWAATWALMRRRGLARPPTTVTAEFHVRLQRPTPVDGELIVRAAAVDVDEPRGRATVEASLSAGDIVTATCRGVFVAVKAGHPAAGRW